eukprot:superscaffoldBa00000178_g2446
MTSTPFNLHLDPIIPLYTTQTNLQLPLIPRQSTPFIPLVDPHPALIYPHPILNPLDNPNKSTFYTIQMAWSLNHRGMMKQKAHRDMSPTLSLDPRIPRRSSLFVIPFGPRSSPSHRLIPLLDHIIPPYTTRTNLQLPFIPPAIDPFHPSP